MKSKAEEIIQFLKENADEKDKDQWTKTVKHEDVYGVKLAKFNSLISKWAKEISLYDIKELWKDGKTESRIIAAKILGKIGRREPEKVLDLLKSFVKDLKDWATTDTLATQGIRGIIKQKESEIKEFALKCLKSKNIWTRRFGIVVFINFPESKEAREIVKEYIKDKEYYIRKAAEWVKRKVESERS